MSAKKLEADACRHRVDISDLPFSTTDDLAPLSGIASQERALSALAFGLDIRQPRFHVVVVGSPGTGRTFSARSVARRLAAGRPTPDDVLLLPNPQKPAEPKVLTLPAGEGRPFVEAMDELFDKLVESMRGVAEGERFKQARSKVRRRVSARETELETALKEAAAKHGLELERSEEELSLSRMDDSDEPPEREAVEAVTAFVEEFENQLADAQEEGDRELRAAMKTLLTEAVHQCFSPLQAPYEDREGVRDFLQEVESVVTREMKRLVDEPRDEGPTLRKGLVVPTLLTEHEPGSGAPVVEVSYPTPTALFGRSYSPPDGGFPPEPGFAVAGALHEANGGFLVLPAAALLKNENLYEQLKACLLAEKFIVPEHNPSYYRGTAEELLFPPIHLDIKVILISGPGLFHDLHHADPEFSQLFKVQARFEPTLRNGEAIRTYPAFLAGLAHDRDLPQLSAGAVGELLFEGGRMIESQTKVTAQLGLIAEIASEAGYRARRRSGNEITRDDVLEALAEARRRGGHFRDSVHELLRDGTIRIDVDGARVGQVNAVSVITDGPQMFGRPCRVTAVASPGLEGPVNIAREVEMSGPIHSKGVLTLTGYLSSRFAQKQPLTFAASLVFEQTYEAIDGDSASSSELYALLSALSGIPIKQCFAVTGAVDQRGAIQAVGGVNDKIESFFDLCMAKGLTGDQGVLIPPANVESLMLRPDVVMAIERGEFSIYAVETVEQGIELLTGVAAGQLNKKGNYPKGSVFAAVAAKLHTFYQAVRELGR